MKKLILFGALATFLFSSCTSALLAWWGVREPKRMNEQQIQRYAKKYHADVRYLYELDTAFANMLKDSVQAKALGLHIEQRKMLKQPLQYWLFDKQGKGVFHTANCYGMPGWTGIRFKKGYDSFPPAAEYGETEGLIQAPVLMPYIHALPGTQVQAADADYTGIIMWNRALTRNSRRLIKAVNKSLHHAGQNKVVLYYVNNDDVQVILEPF